MAHVTKRMFPPTTVMSAAALTVSKIPSVETSQVYRPVMSTCSDFSTTVRSFEL